MGDWDQNSLVHELLQGVELARQLQMYLHVPSSSQEARELLIQKIIDAFEKALAMVKRKSGPSQMPAGVAIRLSESPSLSGSPRSEDLDRDLRDQQQNASRKRYVIWGQAMHKFPFVCIFIHKNNDMDQLYGSMLWPSDIDSFFFLTAKYPRLLLTNLI